jgi:transcription initiation factor IIE alpha subunit
MSDHDVEVALYLRHHGDHTDKSLAKEYGVTVQTIKRLEYRLALWLRNNYLALEAKN